MMHRETVFCVTLAIIVLAAPLFAVAQQPLVGTYKMASIQNVIDGKPEAQPTKPPQGYLVITPKVFVLFYTRADRRYGASEKEKAALWDSLTAWSGSYRLEGNKIIVSVDTSWNEVYNGSKQTRDFQLQGNRLILNSAPRPWGRDPSKIVVSQQEWEKIE
jgi:hypothetical protein